MRDVEHQLRDYWSEITSDLPEPSAEAARQQRVGDGAVRPIQERRPAQRRPAWAVAVAAFAGVLLVGGAAMWLLTGERDSAWITDDGPGDTTSSAAASTMTTRPANTITLTLDWLEGYRGLVVASWVLPTDSTEEKIAFGGTHSGLIDQDPFSASDVMHPQDTRYFEIVDGEVASFGPGTYRFVIEAFVPSGPMRYGCEMPIELVEGEALTITISELPQYTGGGWHWTPNDQLQYPRCPQSVRVHTGVEQG